MLDHLQEAGGITGAKTQGDNAMYARAGRLMMCSQRLAISGSPHGAAAAPGPLPKIAMWSKWHALVHSALPIQVS